MEVNIKDQFQDLSEDQNGGLLEVLVEGFFKDNMKDQFDS